MPRAIAFLRAINVGGRTVKMDRLRSLFTGMDFAHVETFIASGNVLFDAAESDPAALERAIEAGLRAGLGYDVDTFVRAPAEVAAIADSWPFDAQERDAAHTLFIGFLRQSPDEAANERLQALTTPVDALRVEGRELYWLRRDAAGDSTLSGAMLEKALRQPITLRNVRTVQRLALKSKPSGS